LLRIVVLFGFIRRPGNWLVDFGDRRAGACVCTIPAAEAAVVVRPIGDEAVAIDPREQFRRPAATTERRD